MMRYHLPAALIASLLTSSVCPAVPLAEPTPPAKEEFRYLRRTAKGFVPECSITVRRHFYAWSIHSSTGQGDKLLTVSTIYDLHDCLIRAAVVTDQKDARVVNVRPDGTKVRAEVRGKTFEFDVAPGVIVTSAPDWTDVFLLCRRYDRKKGGQQRFPGLWVHPEKGAFQLTFTIERIGAETVKQGDKQLKLDRVAIRLRNNSEYTAWVDEQGTMIRLQPGRQGKAPYELLLEGFAK